LDDFPSNDTQAQYLVEKGLFPDAVILLSVEDEDIIKRLMPPRLEVWKAKMKAKKEKRKAKAAKKKAKLVRNLNKLSYRLFCSKLLTF
jgi:hypothetical protein